MPGLRNRRENSVPVDQYRELSFTRTLHCASKNPLSLSTMENTIKFIPPQIDPLASTNTEASRKNPLYLLMQDLGVLTRMLRYLPWIFMPFRTSDKNAELFISSTSILELVLNSFLFLFESVLLLVAIPAFLILPGGISLLAAAICIFLILVAAWPMQGPRIAYSRMDEKTAAIAKQHDSERWLFINGCMTRWETFESGLWCDIR